MIGQCQSGKERRASLLRYQINISLRRRVLSVAKRCAMLALYGASFAAGSILMLILIQEALHAPLSTVPPAYVESTE